MQEAMDRIARYFAVEYADYGEDLPILEAYAGRAGGPVLELGCGAGRAVIPLAQAGFDVTGVDLSPAMLALAASAASVAGVAERVTLVQGDFQDAPIEGAFTFAFCVMNTFLHLSDTAAQVAALKHWRQHLTRGGILVIEVFHPDVATLGVLDGKLEWQQSWMDAGAGHTVMKFVTRTVDLAEQTMHVNAIYDEIAPDGGLHRTVAPFTLRYIWRYEAELLLERAGFVLENLYGDWDLSAFNGASERMILVARRMQ